MNFVSRRCEVRVGVDCELLVAEGNICAFNDIRYSHPNRRSKHIIGLGKLRVFWETIFGMGLVESFAARSTLPLVASVTVFLIGTLVKLRLREYSRKPGPCKILMAWMLAERMLHANPDRNSHVLGGFTCRPSLCGERQLVIRRSAGPGHIILADRFPLSC